MEIGKRIKQLAKERGLTQKQIADALGVTQSFISALYTDKKLPSLEMVISLCQCLGVSPNALLWEEEIDQASDISSIERKLILKFRLLSSRDKELVCNLVDSLYKPASKEMSSIFSTGNDAILDDNIG